MQVGELLEAARRSGHRRQHASCMYSTDNGPHYNTWPDAGTTPFRSEKNSNWEGAYRVPAFVRWPGHFPAGVTLNGIVAHEDWLPTFAAAGGCAGHQGKAARPASSSTAASTATTSTATTSSTTSSGKTKESPRHEFIYVNDDGQIVAIRYDALEGRLPGKPRPGLRRLARALHRTARAAAVQSAPRPVREGAAQRQHLQRLVPRPASSCWRRCSRCAGKFLMTMKDYPPSQTPGLVQPGKGAEADRSVDGRALTPGAPRPTGASHSSGVTALPHAKDFHAAAQTSCAPLHFVMAARRMCTE